MHPRCTHRKLPKNGHRTGELWPQYTQSTGCSTQCHTFPCIFEHIPQPEPTSTLFIPISYYNFTTSFATKSNYVNIFPTIAQRSSNSDSLTCTSTATSIGDPSTCGVRCLGEWPSTPITVVSESDHGSSASLSSSPMTTSQSHKCCHLFGSHSSSWSICLAPSSLSSPRSSLVSVVSGSGYHSSSSSSCDVEESAGPQSHDPGCLLGNTQNVIG